MEYIVLCMHESNFTYIIHTFWLHTVKGSLIFSEVASRLDEMNYNVHETLVLTMNQDTETTRKPLSTFKVIIIICY